MATAKKSSKGSSNGPWQLKTLPLTSGFKILREERDGRDVLVCTVGKTVLL